MDVYITRACSKQAGQLIFTHPFEDIYRQLLMGKCVEDFSTELQYVEDLSYTHYRTVLTEYTKELALPNGNLATALASIAVPEGMDFNKEYHSFQIPKRTGGFRTIEAPSEALKLLQRQMVLALTNNCRLHPHETAHAYIKQRSPKTALTVHQANRSKWFLKLDIKDFFPSCKDYFVIRQLNQLHPMENFNETFLMIALRFCFKDGALPQGAVSSPLLSNLTMLPFDFDMKDIAHAFHQPFVYTRYADDILISSQYDFDFKAVERFVQQKMEGTPFLIKSEKTRYGSSAGQNWNLGLMLNKDNNITIGTQRKAHLKNSVYNIMSDFKKGIAWPPEDKLVLQGMLSYARNIEQEYVDGMVAAYERKFNLCLKQLLKLL